MSTRRRFYIHVGMPKTGTSYLQSIFVRSREELVAQGLRLLPGDTDGFWVMLAVRGWLREHIDPPEAFTAFERFRHEAAASKSPRALLSQELLGGAEDEQISTLLEALTGYEVHLVVTVRDLAGFAPSAWQQHVRARGTKTFDEYLDELMGIGETTPNPAYDLHSVLDRWGPHVPAERVHVVTVPRRGTSERLLLERYCSVVGVDPDRLTTEAARANTSLGLVQAEVLRRVNVALGDRLPSLRGGYNKQGKQFLAGRILHPQAGEPPRLPKRLAGWCAETAETQVVRLEGSGFDIVGDLRDLVPDPSSFAEDAQEVTEAEVAEAAVEALASILDSRAEEREQVARLREKVRNQRQRIEQLSAPAPDRSVRSVPTKVKGRVKRLLG
jgi:hypothetical protein